MSEPRLVGAGTGGCRLGWKLNTPHPCALEAVGTRRALLSRGLTMREPVMLKLPEHGHRTIAILAASTMLAACSSRPKLQDTAAGQVDTAAMRTGAATPAAGPGIHVTGTDGKSVTRAMRYELTPQIFATFLGAADSIVALEARDPAARQYLTQPAIDSGTLRTDAGLRYLEANDAVSRAITSAGISVKDYFVASIAIAAAERFIADPKSAPPTPSLTKNAEFLRSHKLELDRLRAEREGKPVITSTPASDSAPPARTP